MRTKLYKIAFNIFSYLSDQTGGKPFVVKYKLLIGTFLLGSMQASAQDKQTQNVKDNPPPPEKVMISCYKPDISMIPMEVKAKVTNENNTSLRGLSVYVKHQRGIQGENKVVLTDGKGEFTIQATRRDILVFVLSGYKTREIGVREVLQDKSIIVMEKETSL